MFATLAEPAPTITSVNPSSGPDAGHTLVTITGTGFGTTIATNSVIFGGSKATVTTASAESLTVLTPPGDGTRTVSVENTTDGEAVSDRGAYTYFPPAKIVSIEPASGPTAGKATVTIVGEGFGEDAAANAVTIGGNPALVTEASSESVTVETPPGSAGPADVKVTNTSDGESVTKAGGYTYVAPPPLPSVTSINPSSGPTAGGTTVTITGTGFVAPAKVTIGGEAADVEVLSPTEIKAKTPAGSAGEQEVLVADANGTSTTGPKYTYIAPPTVTSINPSSGPTAGGTTVTITGTGFVSPAKVTIGAEAADVEVLSSTEIKAKTPAGSAGEEEAVVTDANGASTGGPKFAYIAPPPPPAITSVEPSSGPTAGGTSVTITGTGFGTTTATNTVTIGGSPASVTAANATSLTIVTPPGSAGRVAVVVTNATDGEAVTDAGAYTYIEPSPSPSPGPGTTTGGTHTPHRLPPPVLGQSANVATVVGGVSVRLPGAGKFVALSTTFVQIPFGTLVDASHGEVTITAATPQGGTETGLFFDGEFIVTQGSNGTVLATLTGGDFGVCPPRTLAGGAHARKSSKYASPVHLVRRLWANVGGSFSIRGNYAEGVVQGAEWLTEDMCQGTLVLPTRSRVSVTNLLRHRHINVATGHVYIVKAG